MSKELARDLIGAGVHFGHGASRWNPKMKPYIFGKRSKIHIIDVKETLKGLLIAKKLVSDVVSSGKDVIFVGTKRQAKNTVVKTAEKCGMHYVSERWLGGMLTNFQTVRSRLKRLEELEAMEESGQLATESKKQASRLKRELRKIKTNLDGVRKMGRLPGVVIVVDVRKEHLALREARKLGITSVGIIDTDSDPDEVDVAIPANDDSIKAIEILLKGIADAVKEGKMNVRPGGTTGKSGRGRSRRKALATAKTTPVVDVAKDIANLVDAAAEKSQQAAAAVEVVETESQPAAAAVEIAKTIEPAEAAKPVEATDEKAPEADAGTEAKKE